MSKEDFAITGTVDKAVAVDQARRGSYQFAMQYFHFCKVLYENFGRDQAMDLVRQAIYNLAIDRSEQMRQRAQAQGVGMDTVEDYRAVTDLPKCGWVPEWGKDHCPYGALWRTYFDKNPWFREFAPFYCDVIDTTTIENFTRRLSHRITNNVMLGGEKCERIYYECDDTKAGKYTYAKKQK